MNNKEMKKLIKAIVYECINEILAEKYVQQVVTEAVKEAIPQKIIKEEKASYSKVLEKTQERIPTKTDQNVRKMIYDKMGIKSNADIFADIMEDTARSDNPILKANHSTPEKEEVELVSEDTMEKLGIFNKDWKKLL